ncbi:MAG: NYN domain-containing protein [Gammaproteobacteria bacterium]|nr:NYN domain-containing protein [Gammaproteobacteria bacterium]
MSRVVSYIDGFNLYFGLKDRGWKRYFWLDLVALSNALLLPGQTLQTTHYFTARLRLAHNNQADMQRQDDYLDALGTRHNLQIQYGHYLQKTRDAGNARPPGPTTKKK